MRLIRCHGAKSIHQNTCDITSRSARIRSKHPAMMPLLQLPFERHRDLVGKRYQDGCRGLILQSRGDDAVMRGLQDNHDIGDGHR